jgi:transposase
MLPEILVFDGKRYSLPYADLPRPLDGEEAEALESSMVKVGVLHEIVVEDDTADPVVVLDGAARFRVVVKLKLPPSEVRIWATGPLTPQRRREVIKALLLGRKHLIPELKREAERRLAEFDELKGSGSSTRAAAKEAGISASAGARRSGVSGGTPERGAGTDGNNYPAHQATQKEIEARQAEVGRRHDDGETVRETATAMGISTGTVGSDREALKLSKELKEQPDKVVAPQRETWETIARKLLEVCQALQAEYGDTFDRDNADWLRATVAEAEAFAV